MRKPSSACSLRCLTILQYTRKTRNTKAAPTSSHTETRVVGPRSSYCALPRQNPEKVEFRLPGSSFVSLDSAPVGNAEFMPGLLAASSNRRVMKNYHEVWIGQKLQDQRLTPEMGKPSKERRLSGLIHGGDGRTAFGPVPDEGVSPGRSKRQKHGCVQCALSTPMYKNMSRQLEAAS